MHQSSSQKSIIHHKIYRNHIILCAHNTYFTKSEREKYVNRKKRKEIKEKGTEKLVKEEAAASNEKDYFHLQ